MPRPTTRRAKFSGPCPRCGRPITLGVLIERTQLRGEAGSRWAHVGCKASERARTRIPEETDDERLQREQFDEETGDDENPVQKDPVPFDFDVEEDEDDLRQKGEADRMRAARKAREEEEERERDRLLGLGDDDEVPPPAPSVKTKPSANGSAAVHADAVRKVVAEMIEEEFPVIQERNFKRFLEGVQEPLCDLVNKVVTRAMDAMIADMPVKDVRVRRFDGTEELIKGEVLHEAFDDVKEMIEAGEDIFLPGPTGSGKSHLVRQTARVLGMRFAMISCSKGMSEGMLNGRLIPRGAQGQFEFMTTMMLDVYENGGIFLFDEMDAADANTLIVVNSAIANGVMSVPNRFKLPDGVTEADFMRAVEAYDYRTAKEPFVYRGHGPVAVRHPDFIAAAAANTMGTGGDRKYVGRDPLDLSTRDRFLIGTIFVGYSPRIERVLCPDEGLRGTLEKWRAAIHKAELERELSTRTMAKAYKMVSQKGWTVQKVASRFFAGWPTDEVTLVYGKAPDWK